MKAPCNSHFGEDEEHEEEQREPVRTETADRFSFKHKTNERQDAEEESTMREKVYPISMAVLFFIAQYS